MKKLFLLFALGLAGSAAEAQYAQNLFTNTTNAGSQKKIKSEALTEPGIAAPATDRLGVQ